MVKRKKLSKTSSSRPNFSMLSIKQPNDFKDIHSFSLKSNFYCDSSFNIISHDNILMINLLPHSFSKAQNYEPNYNNLLNSKVTNFP